MSVKSRSRLAASLPNYTEKYSRAAPSNDQGGGNKKQGLAPVATHFFISGNGLAGWNQYNKSCFNFESCESTRREADLLQTSNIK